MPTRFNPASRLHKIFADAWSTDSTEPLLDVWTRVFSRLYDQGRKPTQYEVIDFLSNLNNQLELTRDLMARTDFTPSLYELPINILAETIRVDLLTRSWSTLRQNINRELLLLLLFCSEVLADEGPTTESADLKRLSEMIHALESDVEKQSLQVELREFLLRQIELMKQAIRDYAVVGIAAFDEAVIRAQREFRRNRNLVDEADGPEISIVKEFWHSAVNISDGVQFEESVLMLESRSDVKPRGLTNGT